MSVTNKWSKESALFLMLHVLLGLILFPVVTLLAVGAITEVLVAVGLSKSHEAGTLAFGILSGTIIGLAASTLVIWKTGNGFRNLSLLRQRLLEPFASCLEFSIAGALLFGGVMLAAILLLGHTRPVGWDFDRIPAWMGLGFTIFLFCGGLPVGLNRKRKRNL